MTEHLALVERPATQQKAASPAAQIRIEMRRERLRKRLARRMAGWAGFLLIGYWCAAFTFTHIPIPKSVAMPVDVPHLDKLAHMAIYSGLALLLSVWFGVRRKIGGALVVAATVMLVLACYGAFDEISQGWSYGRTPDFRDWLADIAGINFGLFGFFALRSWVRR